MNGERRKEPFFSKSPKKVGRLETHLPNLHCFGVVVFFVHFPRVYIHSSAKPNGWTPNIWSMVLVKGGLLLHIWPIFSRGFHVNFPGVSIPLWWFLSSLAFPGWFPNPSQMPHCNVWPTPCDRSKWLTPFLGMLKNRGALWSDDFALSFVKIR